MNETKLDNLCALVLGTMFTALVIMAAVQVFRHIHWHH
jgi:hypothetical protein